MSDEADVQNEDADEYESEDAGFEQAPKELFMPFGRDPDAPRLSHGAVRLYLVLRHFGAEKNYRVGIEKIADAVGVSDRQVRTLRQELTDAGWLLWSPSYRTKGDHGRSANRYKVLWHRIRDADDPRARAHAQRLEQIEAERIAGKQARRSGGTPPMFT